jgi:uncharacterized protein DUF4384
MRNRWIAAVTLGCGLLTAPGLAMQRAQGIDRGSDRTRPAGDLQFEYQFGIGDGNRLVGVPTALESGDRFVVRLRSNQPAYACLFVTNSAGSYTLMRVNEDGEEPCARVRSAWTVLPDPSAVMRLDDREGVERLYLVVSREPIVEVDDMPERVTESWLVALRDRYGSGARWTHELKPESMKVSYRGGRGEVVAVEQLTFNHR